MADQLKGYASLQRRFAALAGGAAGSGLMRQLGTAAVHEAHALVPQRSRNLYRSIHVGTITARSVAVEAGAGYAAYVEFGTRPHEITPRAAKALRWAASPSGRRLTGSPRKGAAVVFAKRVHHPGTKAHPFLVPGAKAAATGAGLAEEIVRAWDGAA